MRKFLIFLFIFLSLAVHKVNAEYTETGGFAFEGSNSIISDIKVVRPINGGTVIIPEFDESFPLEAQNAARYACKIVEEFMPPCLPLRVKFSMETLKGSYKNNLSKQHYLYREEFDDSTKFARAFMPTIKGVIYEEAINNMDVTYLRNIHDVDFLIGEPDMDLIYNSEYEDQFCYDIENFSSDKFDFVTVVMRDVLKGLGLSCSFNYNPVINGLECESPTTFERVVLSALKATSDPVDRLEKATQGSVTIPLDLKLYAPETWQNGLSLNYFIPTGTGPSSITNILRYDFTKGMVFRDMTGNNAVEICRQLLGWVPKLMSSTSTPFTGNNGSTDLIFPYDGEFMIGSIGGYGLRYEVEESSETIQTNSQVNRSGMDAIGYVNKFKPFVCPSEYSKDSSGISVCVLKKDGTWDMVYYFSIYAPGMPFILKMSDWTFNYDEDEYARTIDGYLRARITTKYRDRSLPDKLIYNSTFLVVDYTPQSIKLDYRFLNNEVSALSDEMTPMATSNPVRLYFRDTEGVERIVLERLRSGARVPTKTEITDVKKGYYDVLLDRKTTFTAIAYNKNGQTRGIPITISPETITSEVQNTTADIEVKSSEIRISSDTLSEFNFKITKVEQNSLSIISSGMTTDVIDINELPAGDYVLQISNEENGFAKSIKFRK